MRWDYVERRFSRFFSDYIKVVLSCPLPFILLPSILTVFLSTGLSWHNKAFLKDDLKLYTVCFNGVIKKHPKLQIFSQQMQNHIVNSNKLTQFFISTIQMPFMQQDGEILLSFN
jgi:hypothetical protein